MGHWIHTSAHHHDPGGLERVPRDHPQACPDFTWGGSVAGSSLAGRPAGSGPRASPGGMSAMAAWRLRQLWTFRTRLLVALALIAILPLAVVGLSIATLDRKALAE